MPRDNLQNPEIRAILGAFPPHPQEGRGPDPAIFNV